MSEKQEFTPTQDLILEVLIARHRLGEQVWTFETRPAIVKAMNQLRDAGLVQWDNGVMKGTLRAYLSTEGEKRFLKRDYDAPILAQARENAIERVLNLPIGQLIQYAAGAHRIGGRD